MRTAYKCRAYPDPDQQLMLARTFGCVRVVWNRTLAARQTRYATEGKGTSYRETDAALTAMKRLPELAWLNEVSSVPLQQTLRHQHRACQRSSPVALATRGLSPVVAGRRRPTPAAPSAGEAASCTWRGPVQRARSGPQPTPG